MLLLLMNRRGVRGCAEDAHQLVENRKAICARVALVACGRPQKRVVVSLGTIPPGAGI